jgi:predicted DNA-binding transcriptional regulator AlpA
VDTVKARRPKGRVVGVGEIASMLNVKRARAYVISQHWSFPEHYDVLGSDTKHPLVIWRRQDIEKWIEENR